MMLLGPALGAAASLIGLYLSYTYNLASGGMIVLVVTAMFLICWCAAPRHGLIARLRTTRGRHTTTDDTPPRETPDPVAIGG
ncbi:metal ABC transporter permease [Actinomadura sp. 6N118]|uniref:metal ABC transporter permease n=1 Tax=Actinomadura sp. 6N118 TaxID=3375151 RepID=UPI0037AE2E59